MPAAKYSGVMLHKNSEADQLFAKYMFANKEDKQRPNDMNSNANLTAAASSKKKKSASVIYYAATRT